MGTLGSHSSCLHENLKYSHSYWLVHSFLAPQVQTSEASTRSFLVQNKLSEPNSDTTPWTLATTLVHEDLMSWLSTCSEDFFIVQIYFLAPTPKCQPTNSSCWSATCREWVEMDRGTEWTVVVSWMRFFCFSARTGQNDQEKRRVDHQQEWRHQVIWEHGLQGTAL